MSELESSISEIERILRNDRGLYHGWLCLSTSKYGCTYYAYAIKTPPEDAPMNWERTMSGHHHGSTMLEAVTLVLEELKQWEADGKPFPIWGETENRPHPPCRVCGGSGYADKEDRADAPPQPTSEQSTRAAAVPIVSDTPLSSPGEPNVAEGEEEGGGGEDGRQGS